MERQKRPYSIQKRPAVKHRHIYYAKFRDAAGDYLTAISTGCTRMDDAVLWCEARLRKCAEKTGSITLAEYAQGFWEPTRAVSLTHLDIAEGYTRNHLQPVWGRQRLRDLSARQLDEWVVELHRRGEVAPATINKILQTLRTIFERAVLDGWISENPADRVRSVRAPKRERSVLSTDEAARLLVSPEPWGASVTKLSTSWPPQRAFGWASYAH